MSQESSSRFMNKMLRLCFVVFTIIATSGLLSCRRERATSQDCDEMLERIVQLELEERGFHDPALIDRKRREMRNLLASELKECQGKRLKAGGLVCVRAARNTERISHECLR